MLFIRRYIFIVFAVFFITKTSKAQDVVDEINVESDSIWTKGLIIAFNFQQSGFSNWTQGGEGSITYGSTVHLFANKKEDKSSWINSIEMGYGMIRRKESGPKKNTDLIIVKSYYGRKISESIEFSAHIDLRSQFDYGYKYTFDPVQGIETKTLLSAFLSPGYVQPALGLTYRKNKTFQATISPISSKLTIVMNDTLSSKGAYGVIPGKHSRSQLGATVNLSYKNKIMENVELKSNLLLFGDHANLNVWDLNLDLFLDMKINKFLYGNFMFQMLYDEDASTLVQMRHVLSFGVTFMLGDQPKQ